MAAWLVMEPPARQAAEAGLRAKLIRDGFSLPALVVPVFWLLWHRMWIEALLAFAATFAIAALAERLELGWTGTALSLLASLFVGFEGENLRVACLRRRGWRAWGAVEARRLGEAEERYLSERFGDEPALVPGTGAGMPAAPLGLLAYPGAAR